ncbi:MAG: TlpA family protein disulfide reductase [Sulfurovaceae bacterium]|nr:TlpA family protein disulfide reductase [Sulfurovaceae bacterium]
METNLVNQNQKNAKSKNLTENKSKSKKIIIISIILIGIGIYFLLQNKSTPLLSNKNFIFKTIRSKQFHINTAPNYFKIEELKNKIVFLKIFGWSCPYCQKEIPELIKLKNKFNIAFDTIAIEIQHNSNTQNLNFIKKYNINYHIINGDKQKKFIEFLKKEYKWDGTIPLTIVINDNGKILAFEVGYKSYNLTTLLETTLKQITSVALPQKEGEYKK